MTNAELAILSLLAEQPRHGYQIEEVIHERGMRDWTDIGFSSIYYILKKLEKEGYITGQSAEAARGSGRIVFHITAQGYRVLVEQVRHVLTHPAPHPSPFLLGLSNLPLLENEEVIAALQTYAAALAERRTHLERRRLEQGRLPDFVDAMFDYSLMLTNAEYDWIQTAITRLNTHFSEDTMENKIDYKKTEKQFYNPSAKTFSIVEVPPMNFLMVDGNGDPNTSPDFQAAVEALYGVAYTLKFNLKKQGGADYTVMPLEGLWWADNFDVFMPDTLDKSLWCWTVMIRQPDFITEEMLKEAANEVRAKKNPVALDRLRFETFHEGMVVQILYTGAFADEGPTIAKMHDYATAQGYKLTGKHHEIYLSDLRRTAPAKLKTVLRHPIRRG